MPAKTPKELHQLWAQFFNASDLDGLVSLYEPEAVFMPQPGQTVSGHAAIREALKTFLEIKGQFELQFQMALEAGELALIYSKWSLSGTDPDGAEISITGQTSDLARRQTDGNWLAVIDNPYGGEGVSSP